MEWKPLTSIDQVEQIKESSQQQPVIIYKHSTRCGISSMVLNRLERAWNPKKLETTDVYFLDLIRHRDVSQSVSTVFGIRHESPQILLISQGNCVYDASHMMITFNAIQERVQEIPLS